MRERKRGGKSKTNIMLVSVVRWHGNFAIIKKILLRIFKHHRKDVSKYNDEDLSAPR